MASAFYANAKQSMYPATTGPILADGFYLWMRHRENARTESSAGVTTNSRCLSSGGRET
jgi:hypothetical protein